MSNRKRDFTHFYIYKTTNLVTGKIYVGQRFSCVDPSLDEYLGSGVVLAKSIKKHGKVNFKKEVLEFCTKENLNEREIFWIKELDARNPKIGYNLNVGGDGVGRGEDSPQWHKPVPQERRDKISASSKGKVISEEAKRKSSATKKGVPQPDYLKLKWSIQRRGRKLPQKQVDKFKETMKSKPILVCEFCGYKSRNTASFKKVHGENCKQNPNYIPKEKITCLYCGYSSSNKGVLARLHFENCEQNPDYVPKIKPILSCLYCDYTGTSQSTITHLHNDNCKQNPNRKQ
jgi:group I intron endonuclease